MWRPLEAFSDAAVPKLYRLREAARKKMVVPPTVWRPAALAHACDGDLGIAPSAGGWVVRSAAPDEDGAASSRAGHYTSVHVAADADRATRRAAVLDVVRSLGGVPRGAVFVQPRIVAERAGVAFFDGFWFERSEAAAGNVELTHGSARGEVVRGHTRRSDAFSTFLLSARRVCGGGVIDVEYARSGDALTLLQVRPALFEVRRNPTLSLANHREILGEVPSPWITSVLERASGRVVDWFGAVDPVVASWAERYAVVLHGRPWMNFSFFFRLMDHWGLPRRWVTAGVGGAEDGSDDERIAPLRLRPRPLLALQARGLRRIAEIPRRLGIARERVRAATTLDELFHANVDAMELAVTTNFAIGGLLTGWTRLRRPLGLESDGALVTSEMMHAFDRLRALEGSEREAGLAAWLARHGHRGPLESDPARPRFAELRARLEAELETDGQPGSARPSGNALGQPGSARPSRTTGETRRRHAWAFYPDRLRERFRDELMHLWRDLRERALAFARTEVDAGFLEAAGDVFLLAEGDLRAPRTEWRERVDRARRERERHLAMVLPVTADLDALVAHAAPARASGDLRGIGIGHGVVRGRVRRARELDEVLGTASAEGEVLVVPSLEPSWAVVFPRFAAVVSELGGELSHAAILLRESRRLAVVDCRGVFAGVRDGELVEVDARQGVVTRLAGC